MFRYLEHAKFKNIFRSMFVWNKPAAEGVRSHVESGRAVWNSPRSGFVQPGIPPDRQRHCCCRCVNSTLADEDAPSHRLIAYFGLVNAIWSKNMGNVKSIEKAVESLPPSELAEFRRWFADFDANAWDEQIEQDAAAGKLDALAAEALADYRAGSVREL